jgi:thiosulfate/3-mercaptopyruvate sulfurtransferase
MRQWVLALFMASLPHWLNASLSPIASPPQRSDLLVDTAWLAAHLNDRNVRIVDMRVRGFEVGHIPGAVLLDNNAIRVPNRPPTFMPTAAEFEQTMSRLGVSNATRVVVYDDRGGIYAARLWMVLNAFGHSNVALLDGGWTKWMNEARPTSRDAADVRPTTFRATLVPKWIATAADVVAAIDKQGVKIVDARTAAEIAGTDLRGIKRGGAIPSSIPIYWEDTFDAQTKVFKSNAEIGRLYRDRGIGQNDDVIIYCQVGMRASHDLFTLALIGHTKGRVYYGSWEEWGNRDDLPIIRKYASVPASVHRTAPSIAAATMAANSMPGFFASLL